MPRRIEELGFPSWCTYLCGFNLLIPYLIHHTIDCLIIVNLCVPLSLSSLPLPPWQCKLQYPFFYFYLELVVDFFCVPVRNYCVGVGCMFFVFVPVLFTMIPTIDQFTATIPLGVYWCFLLSFIVVVLIMIMIQFMIISIAFLFLFSFPISLKNIICFSLTFIWYVCCWIVFCLYILMLRFLSISLVGIFVWFFGCCLFISCLLLFVGCWLLFVGCWLLVMVVALWVLSLFIAVVFNELHHVCHLFQFWYGISICCCGS